MLLKWTKTNALGESASYAAIALETSRITTRDAPNGRPICSAPDFWRNADGNFLDISVLEWYKLFTEKGGKHHWKKVVSDPGSFLPTLYEAINLSEATFNEHCEEVKTYRDRYLAHLDEPTADDKYPFLTPILDSAIFLGDLVTHQNLNILQDAPPDMRAFYEERLAHGREVWSKL